MSTDRGVRGWEQASPPRFVGSMRTRAWRRNGASDRDLRPFELSAWARSLVEATHEASTLGTGWLLPGGRILVSPWLLNQARF